MSLTFARENVVDVWDEASPLLLEHWTEIAFYNDIPLQPRVGAYGLLDARGALRIYTARDGERLVGYAAFAVDYQLHYASSLLAAQDVLFLLPEYRNAGNGRGLLAFAEDQLRTDGVQVITQHVKRSYDFTPLLASMGYEPMETIHVKRLDR